MKNTKLDAILKKAIEKVMPDFRHYYRMPIKAKIVKVYEGEYVADVIPLHVDERVNENEIVLKRVESPIAYASDSVDVYVTVCFWDGDPNAPYISNIRKFGGEAALGGFEIGFKNVLLTVDETGTIFLSNAGDLELAVDKKIIVGAIEKEEIFQTQITTVVPLWTIMGNINLTGNLSMLGLLAVTGGITASGTMVSEGDIKTLGNVYDKDGAQGGLTELRDAYNPHNHTCPQCGGVTNGPNNVL